MTDRERRQGRSDRHHRITGGRCRLAALLSLALLAAAGGLSVAAQEQRLEPSPPPAEEGELTPGDLELDALTLPESEVASPPPAEPPDLERIEFRYPFPAERGGGEVTGTAGAFELEGDLAVLSGGVELDYEDLTLTSERAEVDLATKTVTALGEVILDQGPRRLTGATLTFDLETKTGNLTEATAFVAPDYYFSGAEIAKVDEDVYTVTDGVFTSCSGDRVPDWSFRLGEARVKVDGYAKVKNASLRAKKVPLLYTPYILWPTKERTSGLLLPQPGYSRRRGASLSLAYFQTLGRSYDTTLELDTWSDGFFALGNEFRYRPTDSTFGVLVGYAVDDPEADEVRWKVDWEHETRDLPWGLRGVISYHEFSDFEFFRDFERDFSRSSLRFLDSRGFVSGNWGPHSVNVLVNQRETFIDPQRTITLSKLPEIEYRLRPTRLGRFPLYLELDSSLDYLSVDRSETFNDEYFRGDFFPQLTLPIRSQPWLSLSVTAGERITFYGDRARTAAELDELPPEERDAFAGESLTRSVPFAQAEIVGPSLSRIFDAEVGSFGRFKHVVEPRWTYTFLGDFDRQAEIPLFDEVDTVRSTNVGRFSIVNRLLAKPADEDGGSAREILSFELAQAFSFDRDQPLQIGNVPRLVDGVEVLERIEKRAGPITSLLRFNPRQGVSLKAQASYNTLFDVIDSTSLSGSYGSGANYVGLTWFTRTQGETGETLRNQVRFSGGVALLPGKLRIQGEVNYDFELGLLQQQRYILDYTGQCYGLRFEVRDFTAGQFRDTNYRFSLNLKNVGTFLDLTGGTTNRPGQ